jgi:hypothetical protein
MTSSNTDKGREEYPKKDQEQGHNIIQLKNFIFYSEPLSKNLGKWRGAEAGEEPENRTQYL